MSRSGWGYTGRDLVAYVLGDYTRDIWQSVRVVKIAPDVPAPVWELDGDPIEAPGCAGNVAAQFLYLSRDVTLGTLGASNETANGVKVLTRNQGLPVGGVSMTRDVAGGHVLARRDDNRGSLLRADPKLRQERALEVVRAIGADLDRRNVRHGLTPEGQSVVAVLSDYARGFWSRRVAIEAIALFKEHGVPTVVDPKPRGLPLDCWTGATVIKLNESEALAFAGTEDTPEHTLPDLVKFTGSPIVATRSGERPVVCNFRGQPFEVGERFTSTRPLWASGAGDCFAAYLAAGLAPQYGGPRPLAEIVPLAHAAGAAYCSKSHNAPVHPREARERAGDRGAKLYKLPGELAARLSALPKGSRIGYANGCFDLVHAGHVDCLAHARRECDFLVVFVNSDASYKSLRGCEPVMSLAERVEVLAGLADVGAVIGFDELSPERIFAQVGRCDVLVKGAEYEGTHIRGSEYAERVAFAPERVKIHSSTIRQRLTDRGRVESGEG